MPFFTREHQIDMLLIYGEARKNRREARALYVQRFPERDHPSDKYFPWLENHLKHENENQNVNGFIISEEAEINTLAYIEADPTASTRHIENDIGVGRESARKILKKHGYKSFKYQIHHYLYEGDFIRRLEFCNWYREEEQQHPLLKSQILFSDESRFTNLGMFNRNNTRYWATENHHLVREGRFQERFGINVWLGVLGTRIIGPIFFEEHLTADQYLDFLQNHIENILENLPVRQYAQIFYQQDGAPAHTARIVTTYLNATFGDRWMGTNGPVRWPARSPDLTPLDFFYWGHIKEKVYRTKPQNIQDLRDRIIRAVNNITPVQMNNVLREFQERIHMCQEANGHRFENLIYG